MVSLIRELKFALKDPVVLFTLLGLTLLSTYSIISGLKESAYEQTTIERIKKQVSEDRTYNLAKQNDAGSAAYYAFHFTYDEPANLTFTSRGVRDDLPWKHRIRMLAIEGQIYESDAGNPELSRIGKLDYAFIVSFLLPLLSILLLYDLRAVEIRNNRWEFLSATSYNGQRLLQQRIALRSALLFLVSITPFIIAAIINNAHYSNILLVIGAIALNVSFWCIIAYSVLNRVESGPTTAALLLVFWLVLTVIIPVSGKYVVEKTIAVPVGGEILLTQREAVNDAWDLPKEATMTPFLKRHPQWINTPPIGIAFEWKWYYAFQQVGDQQVEHLSKALTNGIVQRDSAMQLVSLASPPLLTKRLLNKAAETDISAFQHYNDCVRNFHLSLREFHYPMLFGDTAYSAKQMTNLPTFTPCDTAY